MGDLGREDIDAMIAAGLAAYDDAVRARWERIRIDPEQWRCSPWGDADGGFWVVAIEGGRALWFNNIEDGFNWSPFSKRGTLDDYFCDQTEFVEILEKFAQEMSENARARLTEGDAPVDVTGPGTIAQRQTTYWEVRAATGANYRIYFRDKAEFVFASTEYPSIEIADRHPLLVQYIEPMRSLYFVGTPLRPRDLAERIDLAIRDASESWRGLSDYAGSIDAAAKRLADRHGMLTYAPESVCAVAGRVLEAEGVQCSILGAAAPRPGLRVLLLGRSFVIASGFASQNLDGMPIKKAR
jgi:putative component of toxin-antitoxin plasmid stabilization module